MVVVVRKRARLRGKEGQIRRNGGDPPVSVMHQNIGSVILEVCYRRGRHLKTFFFLSQKHFLGVTFPCDGDAFRNT
jgi:hypothetical protein